MRKTYLSVNKKWLAGVLAAGMLMACGCGEIGENGKPDRNREMDEVQSAEYQQPTNESRDTEELLAYIQEFDGRSMVVDEVEWVTIPSERADKLGLEDPGSGFEVYNEKENPQRLELSEDCSCAVLDWTANYVQTEITPEELRELLLERDVPNIPYILTIEGEQITHVQEKYVP